MFRNAPLRAEYEEAIEALKPVLFNLPPKIIAIDGRPGAGKTILGRFLAWRFNMTLLETDLFRISETGTFIYRTNEVAKIIDLRLEGDSPIIVEGAVCLQLLKELGRHPNFHIHVFCDAAAGSSNLEGEWLRYESEFDSNNSADLKLDLPPIV